MGNKFGVKIDTIDNNLFTWSVSITCKLKEPVQMEMYITNIYPNYPPIINIVKPILPNSLGHKIANSKMVQLTYWTPTRNMIFIIKKVKLILDKFSEEYHELDHEPVHELVHEIKSYPILDMILSKLSSFIDLVDDDKDKLEYDDENYIKFDLQKYSHNINTSISTSTSSSKLKKGTGYGTSTNKSWDPNDYIKLQKDKDIKLHNIINELNKFFENNDLDLKSISIIIERSLLIQHLIQQFHGITLIDIVNRNALFTSYSYLIIALCNEVCIYLFEKKYNNLNLYSVLLHLKNCFKITEIVEDDEHKVLTIIKNTIDDLLIPLYNLYESHTNTKKQIQEQKPDNISCHYYETMIKFSFRMNEIDNKYYYSKFLNSGNWISCNKRLSIELPSLANNQLPINYDSSIFLVVDNSQYMKMRALITGPKDTPYDSGCFIFDIFIPPTYPMENPKVQFMNHNGMRFNPNLYADGKVCLSLLGTWSGSGGEKWNPSTSNLLQILVSIQSQIFNETPYFNEPSYESYFGSLKYMKNSDNYNENIRIYTMNYAILNFLKNSKLYCEFEDIVKNHFKLKKEYIKTLIKKWENEFLIEENKKKAKDIINDINKELNSF